MINYDYLQEEYAKCFLDKSRIYMIQNYLKTYDATQRKMVQFQLFPRQQDLCTAMGNANNVVETVKTVQSLFEQESLGAQSVRSDMEAVIKASYNTEDAVRKSVEKSQNLKNVIRLVDTSATSNKETVNKIKMEISQFHV